MKITFFKDLFTKRLDIEDNLNHILIYVSDQLWYIFRFKLLKIYFKNYDKTKYSTIHFLNQSIN